MKKQTNTIQLIKSCQQGKLQAQYELYDAYVDRIYYIVSRYVNDKYYINNILQDTFIKIFKNISTYDSSKGSFNTWVNTIAVRESINHLRKSKLNYVLLHESSDIAIQDEDILSKMNAEDILKSLSSIHKKYRTVFNLYEIDGYKHKEIALLLDITESSSRAYLSRAKKTMQEILEKNIGSIKTYHYGK